MDTPPGDITRMLIAWGEGDKGAFDQLVPVVYEELRRRASRHVRHERADRSFQTTELVNEVYLKLVDCSRVRWQDRAHFFAMAAQLMRRILVDSARARSSAKRGGEVVQVNFDHDLHAPASGITDWVALDDALTALQTVDERKCKVVELRFFGGLSVEETAEVLAVSIDTVHRDWRLAKSWLRRELARGAASS